MAGERDLLFGVLALRLNFIDRATLLAAVDRWTKDQSKPLAQALADSAKLTPERRQLLDRLANEQLELHDGDAERSLASINKGHIDDTLDLELSSRIGRPLSMTTDFGQKTSPVAPPATPIIGDRSSERFRVLRRHAAGGLGIVSVAIDSDLNREVAFKEIRPEHASNRLSRDRFLLEAEITGGLEHPGIVPVYGLGVHPDGKPFYAMRFIHGNDLRSAIDDLHAGGAVPSMLELRKLMSRFLDVCHALHYAHSRGVLHRDIKPANVMLGKFGETLVVDWGLAKLVDRPDLNAESEAETMLRPASGSRGMETMHGSAIGTPAYMSPEQAEGKLESLTAASDVFSLGAMLYEILTGHRAFSGQSVAETLERVRGVAFTPPRQSKSWIPRPLEAICLKAMAYEPSERYQSTQQLASDLESWLADEPVSAWREPIGVRVRRWLRRHPALVATAAAILVLGGLGATLAAWQQNRHARLMEEKNTELAAQRATADGLRLKSEAREQMAIDAVKRFRDAVTENPELKGNPALESLRKTLLGEPMAFFRRLREQLQQENDTRPESLARLADAAHDMGFLIKEIGNREEAIRAHQESLKIRDKLVRDNPEVKSFQISLAASHDSLGNLLSSTGKQVEAMTAYVNARKIRERHARDNPSDANRQSDLAGVYNNIANLLHATGKPAEALETYRRAMEIQKRLVRQQPDVREHQADLGQSHGNVGILLAETGKRTEAIEEQRKASTIFDRLAEQQPNSTEFQLSRLKTHNNLAVLFGKSGETGQALAALEESQDAAARLARTHPTVTQFQLNHAKALSNIGILYIQSGDPIKATKSLDESCEVLERLARANPSVNAFDAQLGASLNNLATILTDAGDPIGARDRLRRAIDAQKRALRGSPRHPTYRRFLKNHYTNLRNVAIKLNDADLHSEASRGLAEWSVSDPQHASIEKRIAAVRNGAESDSNELLELAQRCYQTRRFAAAASFVEDALALDSQLARDRNAPPAFNAARAAAMAGCGKGIDVPKLDANAKADLRRRARKWLEAELDAWKHHRDSATAKDRPAAEKLMSQALTEWRRNGDLNGVRGEAIALLPTAEQAGWRALWQRVERLLAELRP